MIEWQNNFESVLTERTTLTDTYIKMNPVPAVDEGRLVLEDNSASNYEIIHYTSKDASGVYTTGGGARNEDGNSNGIHQKGARIRMNLTAQDMKDIRDIATATVLPDNSVTTNKISDGAVTNDKLADNSVTASQIADGAVTASKMETVLYNGSATRVVALSDTYTNYSQLKITYQWLGKRNSVVMDTMHNQIHFPVSASGQFGDAYRLYLGDGLITCSGTTMTGAPTPTVYTLVTGPSVAPYWSDAIGEIQIIKVVGIKK